MLMRGFTLALALSMSVLVTGSTHSNAAEPPRADAPPLRFGFAVPHLSNIASVERKLGTTTDIVSVFTDFTEPFPSDASDEARRRNVPLLVAWEPWDSSSGHAHQEDFQLIDVINGDHDIYMRTWLRQAKKAAHEGVEIWVRWGPEMNGDWRPWGSGVNANEVKHYSKAWRHVWRLARSLKAQSSITWVWNPIVDFQQVPMREFYPGHRFVDFVALDGFNWGDANRAIGWQSFDTIFASSILEILDILSALKGGDSRGWVAWLRGSLLGGSCFTGACSRKHETDVSSTGV